MHLVNLHTLRTQAEIISSAPRVPLRGCCKARFAGNGPALAKRRNGAAAAQRQPNAEIISAWVLSALALALIMSATTLQAQVRDDKQARAAEFATCAAYYFNAVNVTPVKEYESVYGRGELAFNEAIKLLGRKEVDEVMARSSGEMMKAMASDWRKFPSVEKRYRANCDVLMASLPAQ